MDRLTPRLIALLLLLSIVAVASASGWRPFAQPDSITVYRGGEATVLDSGNDSVLDNDFDLERDTLIAELDRAPRRGDLLLRPDGTFVYTHDGSDNDSDSFRYRAFDGTGYSRATTVEIRIEDVPNTPPRVVGDVPDQEAAEGAYFELELAGYFFDPDPGDFLNYSASGLPGGDSFDIDPVTGVLSGTPRRGDARSKPYDIEIKAEDRQGDDAKLKFDLYIRVDDRADVSLDVRVVANPIGVGETSRWEIVVGNNGPGVLDVGSMSANWATAGPTLALTAPAGCSLSANSTSTPSLACDVTALQAGDFVTYAVEGVQDGAGDNSLIGQVAADDPRLDNNADLESSNIVDAFSEGPTQTINFAGTDVAAGDLNGDGEIDVVAAGSQTNVYFNDGNRALSTPGTSLGGSSGGSDVALLDWNGDGYLDIAIGGLADRTAEVYVNSGSGGFSSADRIQANVGTVRGISGADLDADGRAELVIAGSSAVVFATNDGQGSPDLTSLSSVGEFGVTTADIDMDGDQDIVAIRAGDRAIRLYRNSGSGASFNRTDLQFGSVATVEVADINADNIPDLLLGLDGDDLRPPQHQVAYQQGNGQFSVGRTFGASPVSGLLAGDIDGDGWNDITTVNEAGVHQVYLGSPQGDLTLAPEQLVSNGMQRGVLVDFNSDQSLDLLLIGPAAALEIHANNGIGRLGRGDRIAPDLQLIGERTVSIPAGVAWTDPGATAIDDVDGDITDQITTSGTVNPTAVGTHTLSYRVSDRAGNTATATRTIQVGVNEGAGGEGGGAVSPWLLIFGVLLAVRRRLYRSEVAV